MQENLSTAGLSTLRMVDRELIKSILEGNFGTHFQFATPRALESWAGFRDGILDRDHSSFDDIVSVLREEVDDAMHKLYSGLSEIDPAAALWLLAGELPLELGNYKELRGSRTISLSRGAWLIGVFGQGNDGSEARAHSVFDSYVTWTATYLFHSMVVTYADPNEEEDLAARLGRQLVLSRLVEPTTRMMWIVDEISEAIGKWVDGNLAERSRGLGFVPINAMNVNTRHASTALKLAIANGYPTSEAFSTTALRNLPEETISSLTAPHRSFTVENVERALFSEEPTLSPLVRIEDHPRILNRAGWLRSRDDALLRLVMRASPQGQEGIALEAATAALLKKWGPREIEWTSSVDIVPPDGEAGRDEVDVLGYSPDTAFLGECKANRLSENNSSVGASFETMVLDKAVSQLDLRRTNWERGWRPKGASTAVSEATAFVITLSDYGGMVWHSSDLRKDGETIPFSVFPLYSLILAASTLDTPEQLRDYIVFRQRMLSHGSSNSDELEYILTFFGNRNKIEEALLQDVEILTRPYELSDIGVWDDPRTYRQDPNWKSRFLTDLWNHTHPVTPALT